MTVPPLEVSLEPSPIEIVLGVPGSPVVLAQPPIPEIVLGTAPVEIKVDITPIPQITIGGGGGFTSEAPRTYLTEFIAGGMYVGTAAVGSDEADAVWTIYKVVEADPHPKKVPVTAGLYTWADRLSLSFVEG